MGSCVSLLHAPYSLLLTPYSLLLTPCSSLPAPYSLLLTPCSLLLAPYSLLLAPCSLLLAPYSLLPPTWGGRPELSGREESQDCVPCPHSSFSGHSVRWAFSQLGISLGWAFDQLGIWLAGHSVSWAFSPWSTYLKMDLKSVFFYFFQTLCFWKAETKLEMNLLEFLGSEVIWGRERSLKVIKGQI